MANVTLTDNRAEVVNGDARCVFEKKGDAWVPGWFYLNDKPMLRFKDHEWASVGNLRAAMTSASEADGGLKFSGTVDYYGTSVACDITVCPADDGPGFFVATNITPEDDIEVIEALTAFECPYEYDGEEESLTLLGMEPIFKNRGEKIDAGLYNEHAEWMYGRTGAARMTAPTDTLLICHKVTAADGSKPRYTTILGHWNDCTFKEMYVNPTPAAGADGRRGYKYIMGALNWASSMLKDPNMVIKKNETASQKVTLDFTDSLGGKTIDEWMAEGWQRVSAYTFPSDGKVPAWELANKMDIDWQRTNDELKSMFYEKAIPGLWEEDKGIVVYTDGTRPKAGGYSKGFTLQWAGPLGYQAKLLSDQKLTGRLVQMVELGAEDLEKSDPGRTFTLGAIFFQALPALRYLQYAPNPPQRLVDAARTYANKAIETVSKRGLPLGDYGMTANAAEVLLVAGKVFNDQAMKDKGKELTDFINSKLDADFWYFGNGSGHGKNPAGDQVRPIGYAKAVYSNVLVAQQTGDDTYLAAAKRFANYLIAICYAAADRSPAEDFDTRGWANGANSGRDQIAEYPPMETCEGLRSIAAILNKVETMPAYYDVLFLIARTGLAMLPGARTKKRIYNTDGKIEYIDTDKFTNERAIYARFPFISYENPWDQTLQAPYQGVEPLQNYMTFGGGLAEIADDRLLAIVPDIASYDYDGTGECEVHVWNPTDGEIASSLTIKGKAADAPHRIVAADGSETSGSGSQTIELTVPARTVVKVFC